MAALRPKPRPAYVHGDVDVVAVPRVHVHGVEAGAGAVDDLEPLTLLHCQVDQQRAVREVGEGLRRGEGLRGRGRGCWAGAGQVGGCSWGYLEGHELVVGLGGPGVHLHGALQGDDQELNALVFHWGREGGGHKRVTERQSPSPSLWLRGSALQPRPPAVTSSHPRGSARSPPCPPRWSSPASSPLPGHCAESCSGAKTGNTPVICSFSLRAGHTDPHWRSAPASRPPPPSVVRSPASSRAAPPPAYLRW